MNIHRDAKYNKNISIFLIYFLILLTACADKKTEPQGEVKILFTGDIMLDRNVRKCIKRQGIDSVFSGVRDSFKQADAVVINLECPLTDIESPINKKFIFRGDAAWAKGLHKAGITHACMANNHTNDQGRGGLEDTYKNLKDADIDPIGYGNNQEEQIEPCIIEKKGNRIALFNSVFMPIENWIHAENKPGICQANANKMAEAIEKYRQVHKTDCIIAIVHWGVEYSKSPTTAQQIDAQKMLAAGADAIIGHHPHVIEPVTEIDNKPVFYSLGNFVFDQKRPDGNKAIMAELKIKGRTIHYQKIPIDIRKCHPYISEASK